MKKLFGKIGLYVFLILLALEGLVRVFHLYNELPVEWIADDGIVKWVPLQKGVSVYGNRRQHTAEYSINDSGYNSYREFNPTKEDFELAFLGDSYIEGFHQDYNNSTGRKIENKMPDIEVYEFGHSANDFADQIYLIDKNKALFNLIDHIIIRIKYEKDFKRGEYKFKEKKPFFPWLRHSKLVVYLLKIGITDSVKKIHQNILNLKKSLSRSAKISSDKKKDDVDFKNLSNFKSLIRKYNFDKSKTTLLLDGRKTDSLFMEYLIENEIKFIDYSLTFEKENSKPQTLIYDAHWNDFGRELIAEDISDYLNNLKRNK